MKNTKKVSIGNYIVGAWATAALIFPLLTLGILYFYTNVRNPDSTIPEHLLFSATKNGSLLFYLFAFCIIVFLTAFYTKTKKEHSFLEMVSKIDITDLMDAFTFVIFSSNLLLFFAIPLQMNVLTTTILIADVAFIILGTLALIYGLILETLRTR